MTSFCVTRFLNSISYFENSEPLEVVVLYLKKKVLHEFNHELLLKLHNGQNFSATVDETNNRQIQQAQGLDRMNVLL